MKCLSRYLMVCVIHLFLGVEDDSEARPRSKSCDLFETKELQMQDHSVLLGLFEQPKKELHLAHLYYQHRDATDEVI